ncbi:hypothetical protein MXB_1676, partial [Myxobolus squamalis]
MPVRFSPTYFSTEAIFRSCFSTDDDSNDYNLAISSCATHSDRIIFRGQISKTIEQIKTSVYYDMLGKDVCLGEHK